MRSYKNLLIITILFGVIAGTFGAASVNTQYGQINYTGSGYYLISGRYQYISSISDLVYQSTTSTYSVTIQTSPSGASNYWGACLSTQYNGAYGQNGTICTSGPAGTSYATFDVPSGAAIQ